VKLSLLYSELNDNPKLGIKEIRLKKLQNIDDLAFFGAQPLFEQNLHVGRPNVGNLESFNKNLDDIFEKRWFSNNGEYVQKLEAEFCQLLQVKNCIAVTNATIGLMMLSKALNLKGEVIVPSYTFIATAHALALQGITPIFCDVDPITQNIDLSKIEALINHKTTGILGVHLWGRPCDVDSLQTLAQKYKIKLFFDAAHAVGCTYKGKMVGGFGNAEVFSLHATKIINAFEGGIISTNDDSIAAQCRLLRNFGFSNLDQVEGLGFNGKMTEVSAAMGLSSLSQLPIFINRNLENYNEYKKQLASIPSLQLLDYDPNEKNNYHYIATKWTNDGFLNRDDLVLILHKENIRVRKYYYPGCHRSQPYVSTNKYHLPVTDKLAATSLCFPNGESVSKTEIQAIAELINFIYLNRTKISSRIKKRDHDEKNFLHSSPSLPK